MGGIRRMAVLVVSLALVVACGDSSPPLAETSTDRVRLALATDPGPLVSGREATFELEVTNVSDEPALLTFDTTQRGDVAFSTGEVEVYRWAEPRVFAHDPVEVRLAPGQTVSFPLDESPLPVAPGDYEVLAVITGLPKLQTVQTSVSVVSPAAAATAPPTEPTAAPTPSPAYARLVTALETTVDELALPMATALADGDAVDADGAVLREEVADAFARLTYAELLLAYQQVAGGDVDAARTFAATVADEVGATLGELRSVEPADREQFGRLLEAHVTAVEDYAAVVAAGGREQALQAPLELLEQVASDLGPFVAVTAGGVVETDEATGLFVAWSNAVTEAIRDGRQPAGRATQAHQAAAEAVEPLGLRVAEAYVEYLDLDGFEDTAAVLRQEIVTSLTDEVMLLAIAVDVTDVEQRATVTEVLDENAEELARAVGRAPAIDAAEETAFLERWRRRDAALLSAASPGGAVPDELAAVDDEIAQQLSDATDGELPADEVTSWLEAQRAAVLDAVAALAT